LTQENAYYTKVFLGKKDLDQFLASYQHE